jgi:hypothetical protein
LLTGRPALVIPQLDNVEAAGAQVIDIRPLVDQAPLLKKREPRVSPGWGCTPAFGNGTVELRQVPTGEMIRDISSGEPENRSIRMHGEQDTGTLSGGQAELLTSLLPGNTLSGQFSKSCFMADLFVS